MESNGEESEKCVTIAQTLIRQGNIQEALKFLFKSEKLYPNIRARELLKLLQESQSHEEKADHFSTPPGNEGSDKHRHPEGRQRSASPLKYSQDQLRAIKQLKECKNHYEVLNVSRTCNEDDLKKAYKKLARQFHPDKNLAPGSAEAFKAIVNAQSTLCDPIKRKSYDDFLKTDTHQHRSSTSYQGKASSSSSFSSSSSSSNKTGGNFGYSKQNKHNYRRTKFKEFYWYDFNEYYEEEEQFASDFFRHYYDSYHDSQRERTQNNWSKSYSARNSKSRCKTSDSSQASADTGGSFRKRKTQRTSGPSHQDTEDPQSFHYTWSSEPDRSRGSAKTSTGPPFQGKPFTTPPFQGKPFTTPPFQGKTSTAPPFQGKTSTAPPFQGKTSTATPPRRDSARDVQRQWFVLSSLLDVSPVLFLLLLFTLGFFLITDA